MHGTCMTTKITLNGILREKIIIIHQISLKEVHVFNCFLILPFIDAHFSTKSCLRRIFRQIIKALEEIDEAEGSFIDTTSNDRKKSIPTSTDNIHGSNGDNGSNINFIDLVLALQKHLLSSAGRDPLAYNSNYLHDVTKQKMFQAS